MTTVDTAKLYATLDAHEWAQEFMKVHDAGTPVDVGLMTGWFAAAIGTATAAAQVPEPEQPFVLLQRAQLLDFFGRVALPPWQGVDGTLVGGDVDAAPIAQRVLDWLHDHDHLAHVVAGDDAEQLHDHEHSA